MNRRSRKVVSPSTTYAPPKAEATRSIATGDREAGRDGQRRDDRQATQRGHEGRATPAGGDQVDDQHRERDADRRDERPDDDEIGAGHVASPVTVTAVEESSPASACP